MIKKTLFALTSVAIMTAFIFFTSKPKEKPLTSLTPEKEYTVKGTMQQWVVITSNPDDVPKSQRDNFIKEIAFQIQSQLKLEDSLFKQKALQDSLKKKN